MYRRRAVIKAIATYLPENVLTNEDLSEKFGDWDAQKIYDKTGIAIRHIAGQSECASDLVVVAAKGSQINNLYTMLILGLIL